MADYFLDTSAVAKYYHAEVGSAEVDRLVNEPESRHFISRLTLIETQSVFAGKVRMGVIAESDFALLRRRFLTDLACGSGGRGPFGDRSGAPVIPDDHSSGARQRERAHASLKSDSLHR
jgi:hypothetical protein